MGQNNSVMSFRKRLKRIGYTSVSIFYAGEKHIHDHDVAIYDVTATEPLNHTVIRVTLTTAQMASMLHLRKKF